MKLLLWRRTKDWSQGSTNCGRMEKYELFQLDKRKDELFDWIRQQGCERKGGLR